MAIKTSPESPYVPGQDQSKAVATLVGRLGWYGGPFTLAQRQGVTSLKRNCNICLCGPVGPVFNLLLLLFACGSTYGSHIWALITYFSNSQRRFFLIFLLLRYDYAEDFLGMDYETPRTMYFGNRSQI